MTYREFLESKIELATDSGFEVNKSRINKALKPHQSDAVAWALKGGLDVALKVLKDIDDISICHLTSLDVVRHPLVQKIVNAYEKYEDKRSRQAKPRKTTTAQKNRGK